MWLSLAMNGFYGLKRLTGNLPATVPPTDAGLIDHPITHTEHESAKGKGPDARLRAEPESSGVPGRVQPAARD